MYLQRAFLPSPSPVLTNIYSILVFVLPVNRAASCLYTRTHDVGLPTHFRFNVAAHRWFNAGQSSTMLSQH